MRTGGTGHDPGDEDRAVRLYGSRRDDPDLVADLEVLTTNKGDGYGKHP